MLERSVATSAAAYDVRVGLVIQVPTVALALAAGIILSDDGGPHPPRAGPGP